MRNAAFALFGNLARFGRSGQARATFLEQIHSNLVSLLLHLNDPCSDVRRSCKATLRQVAPLLASEQINTMFQKHLIDDAGLHFGEFMNDLSKILVRTSIPFSLTFFAQHFDQNNYFFCVPDSRLRRKAQLLRHGFPQLLQEFVVGVTRLCRAFCRFATIFMVLQ